MSRRPFISPGSSGSETTVPSPVVTATAMAPPSRDNVVCTGYDPITKAVVKKLRLDGTVHTSYTANKASVDALRVDAATLDGRDPSAYQLRADTRLNTSGTGTTLVRDAASLTLRGLAVGPHLTLDDSNADTVRIQGPPLATLADEQTNVPPDAKSLVGSTSVPGTLRTKQLAAGAGISLVQTGSVVTIENTQTSSGVTLASEGAPGSVSLVSDGTGPSLGVRGLSAGVGIALGEDVANQVVTVASTTSLASEAGGESLVSVGTGAALRTKYLTAGSGITLSRQSTTGLVITNTAPTPVLSSSGGQVSLVRTGLVVRGLTAGYGVGILGGDPDTVTLRSNAATTVGIRPSDVMSTNGQLRVVGQGAGITPLNWPVDTDLLPVRMPAVTYLDSNGAAPHRGSMVTAVHGLPQDAWNHGFRLDFSVYAAAPAPACALTVEIIIPCPSAADSNSWDYHRYTGALSIPAFTAAANATPPPTCVQVSLTATTADKAAPPTVLCVDDSELPVFPRFPGSHFAVSPAVMAVVIGGSVAQTASFDILGIRLTLVPAQST